MSESQNGELFQILQYVTATLSIMCWMVVFTPQLYSNYLRKTGDSLSLVFLYIWLVADLCSIVGILMDRLAWTLFALAIYYTIADTLLIVQVYYYRLFYQRWRRQEQEFRDFDGDEASKPLLADRREKQQPDRKQQSSSFNGRTSPLIIMALFMHLASAAPVIYSHLFPSGNGAMTAATGSPASEKTESLDLWSSATLESLIHFLSQRDVIASAFGYMSAVLYIGSRIPQIIKNAVERSCEGLSLLMFCLAVFGNVMYVASIVFEYLHTGDWELLVKNVPYIVGSSGTLIFDIIIFVQFFWYAPSQDENSCSSSDDDGENEEDADGREQGGFLEYNRQHGSEGKEE